LKAALIVTVVAEVAMLAAVAHLVAVAAQVVPL